jgi:hypothetical protein
VAPWAFEMLGIEVRPLFGGDAVCGREALERKPGLPQWAFSQAPQFECICQMDQQIIRFPQGLKPARP